MVNKFTTQNFIETIVVELGAIALWAWVVPRIVQISAHACHQDRTYRNYMGPLILLLLS